MYKGFKQKFGLYREAAEIAAMRIAPVFELIKTLSPGEVKMLKKRSESPHAAFIGLLEIMVAATNNSDAAFVKQFGQKFAGVNYSETKSYLYQYILRHLTEHSSQANTFAEINYRIVTAEILHSRGLIKEAITVFKQACAAATQAQYFQLSVVCLKRIKTIKFKNAKTAKDYAELNLLNEQEIAAIENDRAVSQSFMLYAAFVELIEKYGGPVNERVQAQFEKIMADPLVKKRAQLVSGHARLIVFDLVTNYYTLTNQTAAYVKEYKSELARYTPALIKDPYYAYRNIFMLHNLSREAEHLTAAEKTRYRQLLQKAPTPDKNSAAYKRLFLLYERMRAMKGVDDGSMKKLLADIRAELNMDWIRHKPNERMNLISQLLQTLIAFKDYTTAEEFIIPALNDKDFEEMLPLQFVGLRLFYLLVLYEQNRFAEMEPTIRATRYMLRTKDIESEVSIDLLNLFTALMNNGKPEKVNAITARIKTKITTMAFFRYQQLGINLFLETHWLQQRLAS
ncbi:MAG: hypothetical protein KA149_00980 [Chitinophagales bacterium]|nr:hypothetical protein [Chitinophagales bacterium]